jgi:hypothetical protein
MSAFGDPSQERDVRNGGHFKGCELAFTPFGVGVQMGGMVRDFVKKHKSAVEKELGKGGKMDAKAILDCYRNPRVSIE